MTFPLKIQKPQHETLRENLNIFVSSTALGKKNNSIPPPTRALMENFLYSGNLINLHKVFICSGSLFLRRIVFVVKCLLLVLEGKYAFLFFHDRRRTVESPTNKKNSPLLTRLEYIYKEKCIYCVMLIFPRRSRGRFLQGQDEFSTEYWNFLCSRRGSA